MKRLGRWLFNLAARLSGAVCALLVAGWLMAERDARQMSRSVRPGAMFQTRNIYIELPGGIRIAPWAAASTSAVLPAIWVGVRSRRWYLDRARTKAGACLTCGYDLRATPERCPECGTIPIGLKEIIR